MITRRLQPGLQIDFPNERKIKNMKALPKAMA